MPMRKRGGGSGLQNSQVKKAVEHTHAAEAPNEKRARLQADQSQQVCQNASRAAETPEKRQSRLQEVQVRHRVAREVETPIQHVASLLGLRKQRNVVITLKWKAQLHDGFMYNPRYDYEINNLLDIDRMICLQVHRLYP
ncbi:hypothetical protein TNCV_1438821 [Trichonephila clavipes]|nr:hypothetical protein TNCV_1438821 [Trichonephila clavipes]